MTDKLRDAAQLLPCPFCGGEPERMKKSLDERFAYANEVTYWCKSCGCYRSARGDTSKPGYADNSTVEARALAAWNTRAALAQQDAQAVRRGATLAGWLREWDGDDSDLGQWLFAATQEDKDDSPNWRPVYWLNAAPTPPARLAAPAVVQDHSDLYAQGWVNGTQVQSLIDWCNSGCAKRADIAFTGGPSRQMAYAIEHLVKRASNLETSEGVFVPRELLAKVANALGLPYEEEHTRLRSKLLDILSFAAPAQRVMLTDGELLERLASASPEQLDAWLAAARQSEARKQRVMLTDEELYACGKGLVWPLDEDSNNYARAVIEAYERKNGIEVGRNVQEKQS